MSWVHFLVWGVDFFFRSTLDHPYIKKISPSVYARTNIISFTSYAFGLLHSVLLSLLRLAFLLGFPLLHFSSRLLHSSDCSLLFFYSEVYPVRLLNSRRLALSFFFTVAFFLGCSCFLLRFSLVRSFSTLLLHTCSFGFSSTITLHPVQVSIVSFNAVRIDCYVIRFIHIIDKSLDVIIHRRCLTTTD